MCLNVKPSEPTTNCFGLFSIDLELMLTKTKLVILVDFLKVLLKGTV